jgi:kinetochore protein NNF1
LLTTIQSHRPHTLPPAPLINAHVSPLYRSQQSQLNAKLQTTQSQNASLMEEIRRQRVEIESLLKGVEGLVGDLEGSGERLESEMDGLSGRAREAEGVLGEL